MRSYISITRFWGPYIPITHSSADRTYLKHMPYGNLAGITLLCLRHFHCCNNSRFAKANQQQWLLWLANNGYHDR